MDKTLEIQNYLSNKRKIIEVSLEALTPLSSGPFAKHIDAMRYSLFVGGKRIRPILCLAAAAAVGGAESTEKNLLPTACALECIHTYSLIHDDLPAMDNDKLRRGKATNHILFGDAGAILAGDSLLTFAFELLSQENVSNLSAEQRLRIVNVISKAAGPLGMAGGQALDIAHENTSFPFSTLRTIHKSKTGALITCSVQAGAIGAGASKKESEALIKFGDNIGLAFQIVDDLLDVTSTTSELGKTAGSDADRGKATYPAYFGIEETRVKARETTEAAISALEIFDSRAEPLRELARYVHTRSN